MYASGEIAHNLYVGVEDSFEPEERVSHES